MSVVTMTIDGMSCGHCLKAVNHALSGVPGAQIRTVQIGRAEVELPEGGPTSDDLVSAVEMAGYNVAHLAEA